MRLPLTVSEIAAFRGSARLIIYMGGLFLVLLGLWAVTVWVEKSVLKIETEPTEATRPWYAQFDLPFSRPSSFAPSAPPVRRDFPHYANLTSTEGKTIRVVLLSRPDDSRITFRSLHDQILYTIDTTRLDEASLKLVNEFQVEPVVSSPTEAPHPLLEALDLDKNAAFPIPRRIFSTDGRTLDVTLLSRPSEDRITFRRHLDREVFTISLDRLREPDRNFIRRFPVNRL